MVRHYRVNIFGKPLKFYGILLVTLSVLTILYFMWKRPNKTTISRQHKENYMFNEFARTEYDSRSLAFEGEKIVHLDLKGAPPKISYYVKLFPLLATLGATGVLIEYEDMFPYTGALLNNTSALNAYSLEDIRTINKLAKQNNLIVIPLIQTFGHMEFILKLSEYKDFREVPTYPQVICPTHENTLKLITSMIEQIIAAHPESKLIHIGADEVYYLGMCDRCTDTMLKYNLSKNLLFLEHINNIIDVINRIYPHIRILMWDDQFRSINEEELKKGHVNINVEPIIWKYTKDVYEELGPTLWDGYSQVFSKVWAASAFKGATGKQ
ncbi:hypothetical protein NQ314_014497 [Rhamnusium bicolor]|uniref:beta-N-acetylhexosaminidase n=1 Tax=Rhamnusium bicolor TaxID=1586634 RepID=A0AAV8X235_9CUCU|nr:hypothetical protein NQ314_014497 [Rhamnusium bicolor]